MKETIETQPLSSQMWQEQHMNFDHAKPQWLLVQVFFQYKVHCVFWEATVVWCLFWSIFGFVVISWSTKQTFLSIVQLGDEPFTRYNSVNVADTPGEDKNCLNTDSLYLHTSFVTRKTQLLHFGGWEKLLTIFKRGVLRSVKRTMHTMVTNRVAQTWNKTEPFFTRKWPHSKA